MRKCYRLALETEGVEYVTGIEGRSNLVDSSASNFGTFSFILSPFEKRAKTGRTDVAIQKDLIEKFSKLTEGKGFVFRPAPIDGVGLGGWKLQLQDVSGTGNLAALQEIGDQIVDEGAKLPEVFSLQNAIRAAVPQIWLDVDRKKVKSMNVDLEDVFDTISDYIGGSYVNDITLFGRSFRVMVKADWPHRGDADDIYNLSVRNAKGEMVPLGSLVTVRDSSGPLSIKRFNQFPSSAISGQASQGYSSGEAMIAIENLLDRMLPPSMTYECTELSLL